jgi:GxxExxY protein
MSFQKKPDFIKPTPKQVFQPVAPEIEKAVETMNPVYEAQIMTYLRLSAVRLGFLINFNVKHLKDGIKRFVV